MKYIKLYESFSEEDIKNQIEYYKDIIYDTFDFNDHMFIIENILLDISDNSNIELNINEVNLKILSRRIRNIISETMIYSGPVRKLSNNLSYLTEIKRVNDKIPYLQDVKMKFDIYSNKIPIKDIINSAEKIQKNINNIKKMGYKTKFKLFKKSGDFVDKYDGDNIVEIVNQFKDLEDISSIQIKILYEDFDLESIKSGKINLDDIPEEILQDFRDFVDKHNLNQLAQIDLKEIIKKIS
jgi:hypothetical protein